MDIAEQVAEHIRTDADWREHYNECIIQHYESMDEDGKRKVNSIFAFLCGWSMETIINNYKDHEQREKA